MPKRKITKIMKELLQRIKQQYPDLKGLYLYGSQVKGTSNKDSDIDVVALFPTEPDYDKELEIGGIISELMYKYDVYIDLHEYTPETLKRNPYYYNEVANKGIYYEAA
ncbi:MAG: nucleotidyltransferase domain-containing protein [Candidatus Gastranaerophilales bacterium]|nr:nucleotidyltransferase domain-containing protein [Candidatus Gastranaerophilales bacterium]